MHPAAAGLLDQAAETGLRVLVGLPWEQHVALLESRSSARAIERRVEEAARACAGHPALLGYAAGNEIPAPIARWHGRRRIERFIERLYEAVKAVDPEGLVTYVNYPTTEYLQLPFLDFACFNVYLERQPALEAYLSRLHNLVGEQPLVMAEIGLDSRGDGLQAQADTLEWQVETVFARNLGMRAATGEIVAYLDDDARPDPDWLRYLALHFECHPHAAVGGPNIPPPEDGAIARCVAASPGGPIHVLVADDLAEHIPGCNMAVRRDRLKAIDGFDPRYRIAGDDVDLCWRIQDSGHTIGFSPAAMVWHHRRSSLRAYLRQQYMYGKAEALLHESWPERYNRLGHLSWTGRVYVAGCAAPRRRGGRASATDPGVASPSNRSTTRGWEACFTGFRPCRSSTFC